MRRSHCPRPGAPGLSAYHLFSGDLGGHDVLSEGQRQIARRCATIAIACGKMEGEAAAGNEIDLEQYGALTDRLGRAFHRSGFRRVPRPVPSTPVCWRPRLMPPTRVLSAYVKWPTLGAPPMRRLMRRRERIHTARLPKVGRHDRWGAESLGQGGQLACLQTDCPARQHAHAADL